jgi:hypothetical protein
MQAGQGIGDRRLDRHLHIVAQPLGIALAPDLGAYARLQFVTVDRPQQIVVDADLEPAHQPRGVVRFADREDRQIAGAFERAELATQAQPVEILQAERDDEEFVIALRRPE